MTEEGGKGGVMRNWECKHPTLRTFYTWFELRPAKHRPELQESTQLLLTHFVPKKREIGDTFLSLSATFFLSLLPRFLLAQPPSLFYPFLIFCPCCPCPYIRQKHCKVSVQPKLVKNRYSLGCFLLAALEQVQTHTQAYNNNIIRAKQEQHLALRSTSAPLSHYFLLNNQACLTLQWTFSKNSLAKNAQWALKTWT